MAKLVILTMKCRKCHTLLPDGSNYCLSCGAKQSMSRNPKSRGNGQGSIYKLKNGSWIAVKTYNYHLEDGKIKKSTRSKSGFKTKKEAVAYLPFLAQEKKKKTMTFKQVYDAWLPTHKAGKDTINCYKAAYKYFSGVWHMNIDDITIDDLQECMDECPKGKRTQENMKALCNLVYKYAIPRNLVTLNMGPYLVVGGNAGDGKDALPDEAVEKIKNNIGKVEWADYVFCQCYLGYRSIEMLSLQVKDYNKDEHAFIGGAKTDAGKDRIVTVSPIIQPTIDRILGTKTLGYIFCDKNGKRLTTAKYREMFYYVLSSCGIDNPITEIDGVKYHKYTPHSCRHTFATKIKRIEAADKDKLELMGHTSTEMLRHYQSVSYDDLRKITDELK